MHVKFKPGKLLEWWSPVKGRDCLERGPRRPLGIRPLLCMLISVKHLGSVCFIFTALLFTWLHWVFVAEHGVPDLPCGVQTLLCGMWDPAPWPRAEPGLPARGVWSLGHWTFREVLICTL